MACSSGYAFRSRCRLRVYVMHIRLLCVMILAAVNGAVQAFPPASYPEQQKIPGDLKNGRDLRH